MIKRFKIAWFALLGLSFVAALRGYSANNALLFYGALIALVIFSVFCLISLSKKNSNLLLFNGILQIPFLVFLVVVADGIAILASSQKPSAEELIVSKPYLYVNGSKSTSDYAHWLEVFKGQWNQMFAGFSERDPSGQLHHKVKPNSSVNFFNAQYLWDNNGFRVMDISKPVKIKKEKNVYRVLAIGASTTLGLTMEPGEVPWPNMLEDKLNRNNLNERIQRFEVINAGRAAYNIKHQTFRLDELLKYDPDLIISYQAVNGFRIGFPFLYQSSNVPYQSPPERTRPSLGLEIVENNIRRFILHSLYSHYSPNQVPCRKEPTQQEYDYAMTSRYKWLYEKFLRKIPADIQIAIVPDNIAVNRESSQSEIDFFAVKFPDVCTGIVANQLHTRLIKRMSLSYPNLHYVNASMNLDGSHLEGSFVDAWHFSQEGREKFVNNLIEPILQISSSPSGAY